MFELQMQFLQRLAVLVMWHGLTSGQVSSHYYLVQRRMSWVEARQFCQRYYVDLAVLGSEEKYFSFLNDSHENKSSFWLGLQRQEDSSAWTWVDGEELSYQQWFRINYKAYCASLESMLERENKLLARYCDEPHMTLCQGPVSPQSLTVDSVGEEHVRLSWNVSAFMQMTPHSYTVTICSSTCQDLQRSYTGDSPLMYVNISNLTSATEYFIQVSAFVVRPDNVSGGKTILQNKAVTLKVKTVDPWKLHVMSLKSVKLLCLVPPLWILFRILIKDIFRESKSDSAPVDDVSSEDTVIELIPQRTRGCG